MSDWYRGIDSKGRLFTFAIASSGEATMYFPDEDGERFEWTGENGARGSYYFEHGVRYASKPAGHLEDLSTIGKKFNIPRFEKSNRKPGIYSPRMYCGPESPHPGDVALMDAWTSSVRAAEMLYSRLERVFSSVEPARIHADVYSHEIRHLIILASTEVESAWKSVLVANHFPPPPNGRWSTAQYARLLRPMKLDSYAVCLSAHPSYGEVEPFAGWTEVAPTRTLSWYASYNETKHDREANLNVATLDVAIRACAALFVMTFAQFGPLGFGQAPVRDGAFSLLRSPRSIADWYIRPLPDPDVSVSTPSPWTPIDCPM